MNLQRKNGYMKIELIGCIVPRNAYKCFQHNNSIIGLTCVEVVMALKRLQICIRRVKSVPTEKLISELMVELNMATGDNWMVLCKFSRQLAWHSLVKRTGEKTNENKRSFFFKTAAEEDNGLPIIMKELNGWENPPYVMLKGGNKHVNKDERLSSSSCHLFPRELRTWRWCH